MRPTTVLRRRREASVEEKYLRRTWAVWALLFFNVLAFSDMPIVFPIPHKIGQLLTQGALAVAFVLALTINPRVRIRPNLFLGLFTVIALLSLVMSVRLVGLGTAYRALRLLGFVAVLWLLTPAWGRRDLVLLRNQIRFLVLILASVVLGLLLSPHKALAVNFGTRRLDGAIWPIPTTQVAHYTAELTGLALLLWLCRILTARRALLIAVPGMAVLLATHTRTALIGLVAGLAIACLSLVTTNRRIRRAVVAALIVGAVLLPFGPLLGNWLVRGQTTTQFADLSGRTEVWPDVLAEARPETNKILGSGLSNGAVGGQNPAVKGLPIDGSWIATYQDQGVVGDVLEGLVFLVLLVTAFMRPAGPARAVALFLIVYCLFASFTETGMGEASPYLLDLTVAASLLMPAVLRSPGLRGGLRAPTAAF